MKKGKKENKKKGKKERREKSGEVLKVLWRGGGVYMSGKVTLYTTGMWLFIFYCQYPVLQKEDM